MRERQRETERAGVCVRQRDREGEPLGEVKALVSEPDDRESDHGPEERKSVCVIERESERANEKERVFV